MRSAAKTGWFQWPVVSTVLRQGTWKMRSLLWGICCGTLREAWSRRSHNCRHQSSLKQIAVLQEALLWLQKALSFLPEAPLWRAMAFCHHALGPASQHETRTHVTLTAWFGESQSRAEMDCMPYGFLKMHPPFVLYEASQETTSEHANTILQDVTVPNMSNCKLAPAVNALQIWIVSYEGWVQNVSHLFSWTYCFFDKSTRPILEVHKFPGADFKLCLPLEVMETIVEDALKRPWNIARTMGPAICCSSSMQLRGAQMRSRYCETWWSHVLILYWLILKTHKNSSICNELTWHSPLFRSGVKLWPSSVWWRRWNRKWFRSQRVRRRGEVGKYLNRILLLTQTYCTWLWYILPLLFHYFWWFRIKYSHC